MKNMEFVEPRQVIADEVFFNHKRRLSLEEDFMNYSIDDMLFGVMYHLATFHPTERVFYITKKNFTKNKDLIKKVCGTEAGSMSTQTLNNHLKKLKETNLIQERKIKSGNTEYDSYTFSYEYKQKYQIIESEMLWYIVSTRSQQAIKIYIYLLNKYNWKKETNDNYIFTQEELLGALGYSTNSSNQKANSIVKNILESFAREGVIKYEDFYETIILNTGKVVHSPRKRLTFVASSKKELPNVS